jgi:hypothetical protein
MHHNPSRLPRLPSTGIFLFLFAPAFLISNINAQAQPSPSPVALDSHLQLRLLLNTPNATGAASARIAKDPRNNQLYYSKLNGEIYRVNVMPGEGTSTSTLLYTSADHGISDNAQGMAIGPDGSIYLVANALTNGQTYTYARIMRGTPNSSGGRDWSLFARTEPYPFGNSGFDHQFNGIIISPDGAYAYVNSGARTDHGEVQSNGGLFPGTRDVPLTAKILRLPTSGTELFLPNDINALWAAGYVFAEGTRNSFDFAFSSSGDLFAPDNGPDRDMSDELNWLRQGLHFGFPWRMGGADNPQQFPDYDPANDPLLDPRFYDVYRGDYHNDPGFPPPPTNFTEPVVNIGPDADKYKDPATGAIHDASDEGISITTFTAHRAPLGLVFDTGGAMAPPYQHHGFMLSFTPGDPNGTNVPGPFFDPSEDMVDLNLTPLGNTNFQARVTRIVGGFADPVDAEIIANRVYVLEYGGNEGLWEITFPPAYTNLILTMPQTTTNGTFEFSVQGVLPGASYGVQSSTNLTSWATVTNFIPTTSQYDFVDGSAAEEPHRFFRVAQTQ